jgi:hypothetical protein
MGEPNKLSDWQRRPLQRPGGDGTPADPEALPAAWLMDFDGDTSAEVDRLLEDQRLCQVLATQDFEGPIWDRFQDALTRYGIQVLRSWLGTGLIFRRCEERGLPTRGPQRLSADERLELAALTVAESIVIFREKALREGAWDSDRGASLRTYFVGRCLLQFPRIYERWLRSERILELVDDPEQLEHVDPGPGPEAQAELRLMLAAALAAPGVLKVAKVLVLLEAGYGQAEAARRLGMSIGAIESLLYRHRKQEGA